MLPFKVQEGLELAEGPERSFEQGFGEEICCFVTVCFARSLPPTEPQGGSEISMKICNISSVGFLLT